MPGGLGISGADAAPRRSVDLESPTTGVLLRRPQVARDLVPGPGVHLVWSLALECGVGQARVVLLDVERDELADASRRVELVLEELAVLEDSPPGLDEGVREGDSGLRQHAPKPTGRDHFVDGAVVVLDAAVSE